jgi:hypothetical protein
MDNVFTGNTSLLPWQPAQKSRYFDNTSFLLATYFTPSRKSHDFARTPPRHDAQAQTMHDQSTYAQIPSDSDQWRAKFFNDMQNHIEARKREVADIDEIFLRQWAQHSVDVRGANVVLVVFLSVIFFRWVFYKAFVRLGAGGSLALVLALSLISPAAMLVEM